MSEGRNRGQKGDRLFRLALVAVLTLVVVGFAGVPFLGLADEWSRRRAAREVLARWDLLADEENIGLYLAAARRPASWTRASFRTLPRLRVPPDAVWRQRPFAGGRTYGDLCDGGTLSVAVHIDAGLGPAILAQAFAAASNAVRRLPIAIRRIDTAGELRAALVADDLVLFIGHANYGRGIGLPLEPRRYDLVPLGTTVVEMPQIAVRRRDRVLERLPDGLARVEVGGSEPPIPIACKALLHLGCRTAYYYDELLRRSAPGTSTVLTHYAWPAGQAAPSVLVTLAEGLAEGRPLATIARDLEPGREMDILVGRAMEWNEYRRPPPYPKTLFVCRE